MIEIIQLHAKSPLFVFVTCDAVRYVIGTCTNGIWQQAIELSIQLFIQARAEPFLINRIYRHSGSNTGSDFKPNIASLYKLYINIYIYIY